MALAELTDRERRVLEAVIQTYVETAEPAGSRQLARRFGLRCVAGDHPQHDERPGREGLSLPPAHLGRPSSDRRGVSRVRRLDPRPRASRHAGRARPPRAADIASGGSAVENILRRAAQSLGVHHAGARRRARAALRRERPATASSWFGLRPIACSSSLLGAAVACARSSSRSRVRSPTTAIAEVSRVLNERLAGLTLREIRASLSRAAARHAAEPARPSCSTSSSRRASSCSTPRCRFGERRHRSVQASVLAEQPEFAGAETACGGCWRSPRRRHDLADALRKRSDNGRACASRSATSTAIRARRVHAS